MKRGKEKQINKLCQARLGWERKKERKKGKKTLGGITRNTEKRKGEEEANVKRREREGN